MEGIALFEHARRAAVNLWPLKHRLWHAGAGRFYKSSKEFKAIMALCWWDPTCAIRGLADDAACRYADTHGDRLFQKAVDGTELVAVTKWFYGTLPESIQAPPRLDRTKQFDVDQLLLLEAVGAHAQLFIARTRLLPLVHRAHLQGEERTWNARFAKARELIVKCSPACQGFLWLLDERKLPLSVALEIMAFEGSA
jgi:hypothetical protein